MYGIAIGSALFLTLMFLSNYKRLKLAYLLLGAVFLISCMIQIPVTGKAFRQYTDIENQIRNAVISLDSQNSSTFRPAISEQKIDRRMHSNARLHL